jgi:hypothetical protein
MMLTLKNSHPRIILTMPSEDFRLTKTPFEFPIPQTMLRLDLQSGEGKITTYKTIPVLGQMTQLHVDTSKWWIYYSDAFGIAMLVIAITGMFIEKGKNSFQKQRLEVALLGTHLSLDIPLPSFIIN